MKADIEPIPVAFPAVAWSRIMDFIVLTKPRITFLVLLTTVVGFYLGSEVKVSLLLLCHTLVGTGLVAGGANALNMWLERELDSRMMRTLHRPLPSGRMQPREASLFAASASLAGLVYLNTLVNPLASLLAGTTLLAYICLYTPLKTRTWLCTLVGAVPGATPPMIGWAAATGELSFGAWVLFAIIYFWQLPHFYAIAWIYREDYANAGFPMLPVVDVTGSRTSRQVSLYILVLILVTIVPSVTNITGNLYLVGAIGMGISFLVFGLLFARLRNQLSAKRLFLASVCYLPALLTLLMADKTAP